MFLMGKVAYHLILEQLRPKICEIFVTELL